MESMRFNATRTLTSISEEEIAEYQAVVRQEYVQETTKEEAVEGITRLVAFYKLALGLTETVSEVAQAKRPWRAVRAKNASRPTYHKEVDHD